MRKRILYLLLIGIGVLLIILPSVVAIEYKILKLILWIYLTICFLIAVYKTYKSEKYSNIFCLLYFIIVIVIFIININS